jgi:hypothetical protein
MFIPSAIVLSGYRSGHWVYTQPAQHYQPASLDTTYNLTTLNVLPGDNQVNSVRVMVFTNTYFQQYFSYIVAVISVISWR